MTQSNSRSVPHVVLHLFDSLDAGGAEMRTLEAIEAIGSNHLHFLIGVTGRRGGALEERALQAKVDIVDLPLGRRFPFQLRRIVHEYRVTTLHTHSATASGAFMFLGWALRIPNRIAHFRSDSDQYGNSFGRRLRRAGLRALIRLFATQVLAVSPAALSFCGRWTKHSSKAKALPSGLRTPILPPLDWAQQLRERFALGPATHLVVHVGRDNPVKNRRRAVEILGEVYKGGQPAHLVFVGRCLEEEEKVLRGIARSRGIEQCIRFVGQIDDPNSLVAIADLVLVTSTREGLPGVVLEAAAVGTPVLSSDLPGSRWISETLDGIACVPLEESDDVWAAHWAECAGAPSYVDRRAAIEKFRASPFCMDNAVRQLIDVWTQRQPEGRE